MARFVAVIRLAGINPYVDVPARVVDEMGGKKAPVRIRLAGVGASKATRPEKGRKLAKDAARLEAIGRLARGNWFRSTIVPVRSGEARLYLDKWMRESAGVGVGDRVRVTLEADRGSRDLLVPGALREALEKNEAAKASWKSLPPSRRREILTYLNFLETDAARARNVKKTIEMLLK